MSNPYGDLEFTPDADYLIGEDGDIASHQLSEKGNISAIRQLIAHRLAASKSDWRLYPNLSAGLEGIIGETAREEVFASIDAQVRSALTFDNAIRRDDLQLRVFDLGQNAICIMIWVKSLGDRPIDIFAFDLQTGGFVSQVR